LESDLVEKPQCDIAYDEISRWLNGVTASKLPLRGMAARSLSVEIYLGVTCPFAVGRIETSKVEITPTAYRRDEGIQAVNDGPRGRNSSNSPGSTQVAFLARSLDVITKRVDELERYIAADMELKRKVAAETSQPDLLSGLRPRDSTKSTGKK
jgi:hypothetical protein